MRSHWVPIWARSSRPSAPDVDEHIWQPVACQICSLHACFGLDFLWILVSYRYVHVQQRMWRHQDCGRSWTLAPIGWNLVDLVWWLAVQFWPLPDQPWSTGQCWRILMTTRLRNHSPHQCSGVTGEQAWWQRILMMTSELCRPPQDCWHHQSKLHWRHKSAETLKIVSNHRVLFCKVRIDYIVPHTFISFYELLISIITTQPVAIVWH